MRFHQWINIYALLRVVLALLLMRVHLAIKKSDGSGVDEGYRRADMTLARGPLRTKLIQMPTEFSQVDLLGSQALNLGSRATALPQSLNARS
jgi:hypothetical protein